MNDIVAGALGFIILATVIIAYAQHITWVAEREADRQFQEAVAKLMEDFKRKNQS